MCLSDPIRRSPINNIMSDSFEIRTGLKQGKTLSPPIFNFVLEYAILKLKEDKNKLTLNDLNQLFLYVDDVDLI